MTDAEEPTSLLIDELRAVLAGIARARRRLADGDLAEVETLWSRLDVCARRIDTLDGRLPETARPLMLAITDELEQAIAAFGSEHRDLGDKLRSASRSIAADTAYRQAGLR